MQFFKKREIFSSGKKILLFFLLFSFLFIPFKTKANGSYAIPSDKTDVCGYSVYNASKDERIIIGGGATNDRTAGESIYDPDGTNALDLNAIELYNQFNQSGVTSMELDEISSIGPRNKAQGHGFVQGNKNAVLVFAFDEDADGGGNHVLAQIIFKDKDGDIKVLEKTDGTDSRGIASGVAQGDEAKTRACLDALGKRTGVTNLADQFLGNQAQNNQNATNNAVNIHNQDACDVISSGTGKNRKMITSAEESTFYNSGAYGTGPKVYSPNPNYENQKKFLALSQSEREKYYQYVCKDQLAGNKPTQEIKNIASKLGNLYGDNVWDSNKKKERDTKWGEDRAALQRKIDSTYINQAVSGGECKITALGNCLMQILYYILQAFAFLLGIVGQIFEFIIEKTVVELKNFINQLGVIEGAWTTFRDLANIAFIFILLYLGISQILGLDEHGVKHTLSKLIIFGVLLNFSLFFTKVIIDTSNIVTLGFYNKIEIRDSEGTKLGLGQTFMSIFRIQEIYAGGQKINLDNSQAAATGARVFAGSESPITTFIMGIILILGAMCFFIAASFLFLGRIIVFIFVLMTSPLAFAGMILHASEHEVQHLWWSNLLKNAVVAPVFMMMTWAVINILTSETFKASIGIGSSTSAEASAKLAGYYGTTYHFIGVAFNFSIAIGLMFGVMIIAEHIGSFGSGKAMSAFNTGFNKFAMGAVNAGFRNTVGRTAYWAVEKTPIARIARRLQAGGKLIDPKGTGMGARLTRGLAAATGANWAAESLFTGVDKGLSKLTKTAFSVSAGHGAHGDHGHGDHGEEGSFVAEKYRKVEAMEGALYEVRDDPKKSAQMMAEWIQGGWSGNDFNTKITAQKKFEDMDTKDQAELLLHLKDMSKGGNELAGKALESFESRLSKEEKTRVDKAQEGPTEFNRIKMDELINVLKTQREENADGKINKELGRVPTAADLNTAKQNVLDYYDNLKNKQKLGLDSDQLFVDKNGHKVGEKDKNGRPLYDENNLMFEDKFDGTIVDKVGQDLNREEKELFAKKVHQAAGRLGISEFMAKGGNLAAVITQMQTDGAKLKAFFEEMKSSTVMATKMANQFGKTVATLNENDLKDVNGNIDQSKIDFILNEYKQNVSQADSKMGKYGLSSNGRRNWDMHENRRTLGQMFDERN